MFGAKLADLVLARVAGSERLVGQRQLPVGDPLSGGEMFWPQMI